MSDVIEALTQVMEDVRAVGKDGRNTHANYNFRGIDAVVNAVGPALRKHGVVVVPTLDSCTYEAVQTSTGKPANACRVQVTYTFHKGDSSLPCSVAAEAWDSGDKAAPKAMSVAFRTALLQALSLPTDEPDPDAHTYERAEPAKANGKANGTTSPKALVVQKLRDEGVDMQRFVDFLGSQYGVEKFDELAEEDRTKVVTGLTTGDLVAELKADA